MTTDGSAYPDSWTPRHIKAAKAAEAQRANDAEQYLANLSDADYAALTDRIRPPK